MIVCDICNFDVTDQIDRTIIKIKGEKKCLCVECESCLFEYIESDQCKIDCINFKEQFKQLQEGFD